MGPGDDKPRRRPVERREIEDVARRALALSDADKLELIATLSKYLLAAGKQPVLDRQITEREITLTALRQAAAHLAIASPEHPSPAQYDAAARELALGVSRSKIIRAWGSWRLAAAALAGEPTRETPAQKTIRRAASGRSREMEEPLSSLRAWLVTQPAGVSQKDYDDWRGHENERQGARSPMGVAHVSGHGAVAALALPWALAVKVARGAITVAQAHRSALDQRRGRSHSFSLISAGEVAEMLGARVVEVRARQLNDERFPHEAGEFKSMTIWRREDIERYLRGESRSPRRPHGLKLIGSAEVAGMLGRQTQRVREALAGRQRAAVPPPAGRIGQAWVWHRADVERWLKDHSPDKRPRNS